MGNPSIKKIFIIGIHKIQLALTLLDYLFWNNTRITFDLVKIFTYKILFPCKKTIFLSRIIYKCGKNGLYTYSQNEVIKYFIIKRDFFSEYTRVSSEVDLEH